MGYGVLCLVCLWLLVLVFIALCLLVGFVLFVCFGFVFGFVLSGLLVWCSVFRVVPGLCGLSG